MGTRVLSGCLAIGVLLSPFAFGADKPAKKPSTMDQDMRRAIAFEHYKDVAAARQERKERVHPSVSYDNANRSTDNDRDSANRVKDPGPKK